MATSQPAGRAHFKGMVLRELVPWLNRRFGVEDVKSAFMSVPGELRAGLDLSASHLGALPSAWYDARIYKLVLDALLATTPATEHLELAREAGKTIVEQTFRGVYAKLFRLMATPPLYARYVQKLWDMHYDSGKVTIDHLTASRALNRVEGWQGHHSFVCAVNRQSGAVVYSMMGLQNVAIIHERCAWPTCEALYTWDE
ncbi:MAG TPA: hypothetical protein VI072_16980 [Polyangiaceae bacterium]